MMKIITIEQTSPQWMAWRKSGLGASDLPALMGVCPYRTAKDIWNDKKGLGTSKTNSAMQRGRFYEDEARRVFNREFKHPFVPICCEHEDFPHFRASLDGFCSFTKQLLEVKVPSMQVMEMARFGQVPINYLYQMQWQFYCTDAVKGYFFCYHPESLTAYMVEVYPDHEIIDNLIEKATEFWDMLQKYDEYPADTKKVGKTTAEKLERMSELRIIKANAEEEYERLLSEVLAEEGQNLSLECDKFVLKKGEKTTVDYKTATLENQIDISKYRKPTTFYWTLRKKCT